MNVADQPVSLRLKDRIERLMERTQYRLMTSLDDQEAVFRLRYRAYRTEDIISKRSDQRLTDRFDAAGEHWLFGIYIDGKIASSIRIHLLSGPAAISPAREAFPEAIDPLLDQRRVVVDPNRFVADRSMGRRHPELAYVTLRLPFLAADFFGADLVTATVRVEHQAFYGKVLRYVPYLPPRAYLTLLKPLGLMMVDFKAERDNVLQKYPFFASQFNEKEIVFAPARPPPGCLQPSFG